MTSCKVIPFIGEGGSGKSSAALLALQEMRYAGTDIDVLYIPGAVVNYANPIAVLSARHPNVNWQDRLGAISTAPTSGNTAYSISKLHSNVTKMSFVDLVEISIMYKLMSASIGAGTSLMLELSRLYRLTESSWTMLNIKKAFYTAKWYLDAQSLCASFDMVLFEYTKQVHMLQRSHAGANGSVITTTSVSEDALKGWEWKRFPSAIDGVADGTYTTPTANIEYTFRDYLNDKEKHIHSLGVKIVRELLSFFFESVRAVFIDSYETMTGSEPVLAPGAIDIGPTIKIPDLHSELSTMFSRATILISSRLPAQYFATLVANAQSGIFCRGTEALYVPAGYRSTPYLFKFEAFSYVLEHILYQLLIHPDSIEDLNPLSLLPTLVQNLSSVRSITQVTVMSFDEWIRYKASLLLEDNLAEKDSIGRLLQSGRLMYYENAANGAVNASLNALIRASPDLPSSVNI